MASSSIPSANDPAILGGEEVRITFLGDSRLRRPKCQPVGVAMLREWAEYAIDDPLPSATLQVVLKLVDYRRQAPKVEGKPLGLLPRWRQIITAILDHPSVFAFSTLLVPMSCYSLPPTAPPYITFFDTPIKTALLADGISLAPAETMIQLGRFHPQPLRVPPSIGHAPKTLLRSSSELGESAVEDEEDCGNWEDLDIAPVAEDRALFQRLAIRSQPIRRSNLTLALAAECERTPAQPTMAASEDRPTNSMIIPARNPAVLSPEAIRRSVLATELSNSLRQQIVWERQYKNSTAAAAFKRRHTSSYGLYNRRHNLKPVDKKAEEQDARRFNQPYSRDYHAMGW